MFIHVRTTEPQFNKDFANLFEWFRNNFIHFGEGKIKCVLFGSKQKIKRAAKQNVV